ncbi:Sugar fermentation stimulation protein SfsA [hydrothermal vent metagenome]|uniref:Sugar fermentation stimulation protein SfsA n=1 Tax=hydrothermal vent metagenome TaxID=652676 RepID=A0A3B0XWD9_9ZZZZ
MRFDSPLIKGRLIKRYKRFLADVVLEDGSEITAHCANTGAMTGCAPANANVWLNISDNPARKYPHSWQLVELKPGVMACINTAMTNKLVHEALLKQQISELTGFDSCRTEVAYGEEKSRVDFLLSKAGQAIYVEVKHVTLSTVEGVASFPDAVSKRGQKHLRELTQQVKSGDRAVLLFIIMRTDVNLMTSADAIDAQYGRLLREAISEGVEVLAYCAHISPAGLTIDRAVPFEFQEQEDPL